MTNENDETPAGSAGPYTPEQHAAWTEQRDRRKSQVGLYYGLGPEPEYGTAQWFDWIESLYQNHDWKIVPRDWKPGDPTAEDLECEAIRKADEALARIIESSRGGRST
jgi:hypothetical protein